MHTYRTPVDAPQLVSVYLCAARNAMSASMHHTSSFMPGLEVTVAGVYRV